MVTEGEARRRLRRRRDARGIPLRSVAPNAVTALALCSGLTAIRFAVSQQWELAVVMIMIAALLDGIDGRIARMLHGESRFGAELDSLSDAISFGVSPALVLYLWSLRETPPIGWIAALVYAVFCALRLARFNAAIDVEDQPHKSAGFLTGVPSPAGAGLALLPLYLWIGIGTVWPDSGFRTWLHSPWLVAPWLAFVAVLMVSSFATYSWSSVRLRRTIRFEAIVVVVAVGAALVSAPWPTLSVIAIVYLIALPFSATSYRRIKQLRAAGVVGQGAERPRGP